MLLNEFLEEHKTVQAQGETIARLEKQVEALTNRQTGQRSVGRPFTAVGWGEDVA
jgi:hypothetical protein